MTTNANNAAVIENGTEVLIPLNKLKKHPKNARKTPHSEASVEAKAASIAAKGMLQNLVVEPETSPEGEPTGVYLVSIGEGRRLAQLLRVKRKEIKKTEPIRCVIDTTNDPAEISLDENVTRENLHPADTCSTKARQGKTGCKGRTIPMDKLDHLVADHLESRLLQPQRLETVLASVIDRRQERDERRREHLAELHRRITETDQRLGRLYDAIESGLVDKDDAVAKERMAGLKALRDQATADAERIQIVLDSSSNQAVSPDMLETFARKARERIRFDDGGYRRDHLRALAQRVEVADNEVRIMGSKSELLRTLVAASSVETAAFGVHSSVLKWRTRQDSNL